MSVIRLFGGVFGLVLLSACVTINIYFPAAQAEEAAERIVEDILDQVPTGDKGSLRLQQQLPERGFAAQLLDLLVPPAAAAQPDFNVDTPEIRQLQASMKQRNQSLLPFYNSGAVGFTRDALIAVRDGAAIPLKEKNSVNKLVAAENGDRNALYKAIAKANGQPSWEGQIRQTFARTWTEKASRGWWYQDAGGGWKQK